MKNKTIILILSLSGLCFGLHPSPQSQKYSDQECLICHGLINIAQVLPDGVLRSLYVNPEEWAQDVHHKGKLLCVDCHPEANPYVHFREGFRDVDCARCHPEQAEEFLKNIHFEFTPITPGKRLPLCYDCHSKHYVLRHDDPSATIHEQKIEATCAECHPEVMVKSILRGASLGKISGHRKGDISEKFDMAVCIQCHAPDHGTNTVYKEFCARCHDPQQTLNVAIGPTHLNSAKWLAFNTAGSMFALFLILGIFVILGYKSRKSFATKLRDWHDSMRLSEAPGEQGKKEATQNDTQEENHER